METLPCIGDVLINTYFVKSDWLQNSRSRVGVPIKIYLFVSVYRNGMLREFSENHGVIFYKMSDRERVMFPNFHFWVDLKEFFRFDSFHDGPVKGVNGES